MNRSVAGCRQTMSMTSSPFRLPVWPRKDFSPLSWSSGRYSKDQSKRPMGNRGSLGSIVQPVKAREHSRTSVSV